MKNNGTLNENNISNFHTVDFFRNVKAHIAKETEGMSFEQFKQYLADQLKKSDKKVTSH